MFPVILFWAGFLMMVGLIYTNGGEYKGVYVQNVLGYTGKCFGN
jgi:hypothetical protein